MLVLSDNNSVLHVMWVIQNAQPNRLVGYVVNREQWLTSVCYFRCRPSGLMDKASDFESEDCRFESCLGRNILRSAFVEMSRQLTISRYDDKFLWGVTDDILVVVEIMPTLLYRLRYRGIEIGLLIADGLLTLVERLCMFQKMPNVEMTLR